jgi:hypothetical protein
MFTLGQRLLERPGIDFSGYSERAGMYSKLIPTAGKEKTAISNLILKSGRVPFQINEFFTDPHLTLIWSKPVISRHEIQSICEHKCRRYAAHATGIEYWEGHGKVGYIVLNIKSPDIEAFHELLIKLGADHSHNSYEPHVTIASGVGALNPEIRNWIASVNEKLKNRPLPISFGSLSFSDLYD